MKFLKVMRYRNELEGIIIRLDCLLKDAKDGNATKVDNDYWIMFLERMYEIKESNLIGDINEKYSYYKGKYEKYILPLLGDSDNRFTECKKG